MLLLLAGLANLRVLPSRTIFLPHKQGGISFFHLHVSGHESENLIHRSCCDSAPSPSLLLVSTERNEEMEQVPGYPLKGSLVQREFDVPGSSG